MSEAADMPDYLRDAIKREPLFERFNGLPDLGWLNAIEDAAYAFAKALIALPVFYLACLLLLLITAGAGLFVLPFLYAGYLCLRVMWQLQGLRQLAEPSWRLWDLKSLSYRAIEDYIPWFVVFKQMRGMCIRIIILLETLVCLGFVALFFYAFQIRSEAELVMFLSLILVLLHLKIIFLYIQMAMPICYFYFVMRSSGQNTALFWIMGLLVFSYVVSCKTTLMTEALGMTYWAEVSAIVLLTMVVANLIFAVVFGAYLAFYGKEILGRYIRLRNIYDDMKAMSPHLCPPEVLKDKWGEDLNAKTNKEVFKSAV